MADGGMLGRRDSRQNGGLSPAEMAKFFGTSDGRRDSEGVLIMDDAENGKPKKEQARPPEKTVLTDAQLDVADRKSREFHADSQLQVLSTEIDDILDKVHNAQVGKIGGGKDNFSDLIIRNLARDLATKVGAEQRKQNTDSIQGKLAQLGAELSKLGPQMDSFWKNQVSMNRLNLPN